MANKEDQLRPMKWAFIDYENVGCLARLDLSGYEKVVVFLGAKQPKLDFADKKYDKPLNLMLVQIKATQQNNLDFHLAYYLGRLDAQANGSTAFDVISNDTGFAPLIAHIRNTGRICRQVKPGGLAAEVDRFVTVILALQRSKRPKTLAKLRNHIASHFSLQGNEMALDNRVEQLKAAGVIEVAGTSVSYMK